MAKRALAFIGTAIVAVWLFLEGLGNIWPAFSSKTIPQWLTDHHVISIGAVSLHGWASLVVGLGLLAMMMINRFWLPNHALHKNTASWDSIPKRPVVGKTFENEQVVIDATRFINCKFRNVTFVFEGTGPFEFDGVCEMTPPLSLQTAHPAIQVFMGFQEALKQLPGATATAARVDPLGNKSPIPPIHLFGMKLSRNDDRVAGRLQIQRAEWGIDNHFIDVTTALRAHIHNDRIEAQALDDTFAIAPHLPGQPKFLKVAYLLNGLQKEIVVAEGRQLVIPEMPQPAGFTATGSPDRIYDRNRR